MSGDHSDPQRRVGRPDQPPGRHRYAVRRPAVDTERADWRLDERDDHEAKAAPSGADDAIPGP